MRMTASWSGPPVDLPNTRLWRDDPRPMASSPLLVNATWLSPRLNSPRVSGQPARCEPIGGDHAPRQRNLREVQSHVDRNRLTSDAPYKACSGFTHVTACRIAQSPKATFVTRLRPGGLPLRTARQLPAQPTTRWVEPSSTGRPRPPGARKSRAIRASFIRPLTSP